jgi:hypothetical protein
LFHYISILVPDPFISGSFCGQRLYFIPHYHFVESQTSTELASDTVGEQAQVCFCQVFAKRS